MEATDCEERQSEEHIASVSPVSPVSPEYSEAKLSAVLAKLHEDTTDRSGNVRDIESDDDYGTPKKTRVRKDSDDEDEEKGNSSPSKPRRILMDSDDNDSGPEDERDEKARSKRLLGSDISDSDEDGDRPRGEEEVGELMANIFGDDSDDDGGEEREGGPEGAEDADQHNYRERDDREDDPGFEWDFDVMMRDKKAEKKKKRRRRDGGIDIINDDDGTIAMMVEAMKAAAKDDRHSNMERKPALKKRRMLSDVKVMLLRADMVEAMIDGGMMSAVSEWLAPLPDKSLPALEIRTELLKILQGFGRLEQSILKQSGLGKAVMLLYKHPRETKSNKEMAAKLIREWARPIFQLDSDFRSVTREERVQRDLDHMPQIKKRRMSNEAVSSKTHILSEELRPGDKGYVGRARVPKPSTKDYVVRPKSLVEGEFKGERKGKAYSRLDKTQRDFMERTKKFKAKRAVGVSLEGRNMAL